jgi:methyl-accepting chemotaxis protein
MPEVARTALFRKGAENAQAGINDSNHQRKDYRMLSNIKIGPKLIGGFIIVALIAGVIGIFGIVNMNKINNADTVLYTKMTVPISIQSDIATAFQRIRINSRDILRAKDNDEISAIVKTINDLKSEIDAKTIDFEKLSVSAEMNQLITKFKTSWAKYTQSLDDIVKLAQVNKDAEGYAILDGKGKQDAFATQEALDSIQARKTADAKIASDNNTKTAKGGSMVMIVTLIIGVLLALIIGIALTVSLTRPLTRAVEMIKELAQGHLGMRLKLNSRDELGIMAQTMDKFADDLQTIVVGTMQKISVGDVSMDVSAKDDKDEIAPALRTTIETIREIITEVQKLTLASQNGMLSERAKPDQFKGSYFELIQGINTMLDAILIPIGEGNRVLAQVSEGKIDELIAQTYKGDHEKMKLAINNVAAVLQNLTNELGRLTIASREGRLSERGKADQFKGAYGEVILGVNSMLEAILQPINEAAAVLEKVAMRDMTPRVKGDYKGDHAKIKDALNTTVDNLDTALQQVAQGTEQVSSAGQQIAAGSQALAQGANEQASSLEEVSSSLEEMASMTKQNAENANQAKTLAGEANSNAAQGKQAMSRMSESINKIKESSDQTAKIVKTIDEIAMQTNLLALNAAVEAARAGEAGRGFAVVAEEVRNLAQRSAEAAKNTANMIEESVKNAEDGVKIAGEVAQSFESIATGNAKVNDLIAEIAAASGEQSQGIDQVNTAVAEMDKVTQQNAANSEESASAAEELSSQAEELQSMVAQFTLTNTVQKGAVKSLAHHEPAAVHHAQPLHDRKNEQRRKADNGHSLKSAKAPSHHEGKEINPKQAIPLDDNEVLKEF